MSVEETSSVDTELRRGSVLCSWVTINVINYIINDDAGRKCISPYVLWTRRLLSFPPPGNKNYNCGWAAGGGGTKRSKWVAEHQNTSLDLVELRFDSRRPLLHQPINRFKERLYVLCKVPHGVSEEKRSELRTPCFHDAQMKSEVSFHLRALWFVSHRRYMAEFPGVTGVKECSDNPITGSEISFSRSRAVRWKHSVGPELHGNALKDTNSGMKLSWSNFRFPQFVV